MASARHPAPRDLGVLLRDRRPEIIDAWTRRARAVLPADQLSAPAALDHLPELIDDIARRVTEPGAASAAAWTDADAARAHAMARLARGFGLDDVMREYSVLKAAILDTWRAHAGPSLEVAQVERMERAFDEALRRSADHYAEARGRMLTAMEKVTSAAFGATDLGQFLRRLLGAARELSDSIDTAAILLVEGDELVVGASMGFDGGRIGELRQRIGDGFAGRIAVERKPVLVHDASAGDPRVRSPIFAENRVRALYGVPLLHGERVLGVAHIGSRAAQAFCAEEMFLFSLMASRASGVIVQASLMADERRARLEAERVAGENDEARRHAEETAALLDLVFRRAPIGVALFDTELRYVRINETLARSHRRAIAEHIGRTPREMMDDVGAARVVEARMREAMERGDAVVGSELAYRASCWLMSYYPLVAGDGELLGVGKIAVDITERKEAEDAERFMANASKLLAASTDIEEAMKLVADMAVPAIAEGCVVDLLEEHGVGSRVVAVAHADPAKTELTRQIRTSFPLMVGGAGSGGARPQLRVAYSGRAELFEELDDAALRKLATNDEHYELTRALDVRSMIVAPVVGRKRSYGSFTFIRGDAARRFTTRDLGMVVDLASRVALAADNAALLADARRVARAREEIAAVVAHDLKTPLNAMMLASQLVERRLPDSAERGPIRKQIETIKRSVQRMSSLINDVLTMASLQAGRLPLEAKPSPVAALVDEAISLYEPIAEEKGVRLLRGEIDPLACVRVDPERILQVLANLLGNAVKFTPSGERIVLAARVARRSKDDSGGGGEVVFTVSDTGPGIKEDDLPHIFEPFFSGERHKRGGTGLGLYIARGVVEAHGGAIWVESKRGAGTTFFFSLPAAPPLAGRAPTG